MTRTYSAFRSVRLLGAALLAFLAALAMVGALWGQRQEIARLTGEVQRLERDLCLALESRAREIAKLGAEATELAKQLARAKRVVAKLRSRKPKLAVVRGKEGSGDMNENELEKPSHWPPEWTGKTWRVKWRGAPGYWPGGQEVFDESDLLGVWHEMPDKHAMLGALGLGDVGLSHRLPGRVLTMLRTKGLARFVAGKWERIEAPEGRQQ